MMSDTVIKLSGLYDNCRRPVDVISPRHSSSAGLDWGHSKNSSTPPPRATGADQPGHSQGKYSMKIIQCSNVRRDSILWLTDDYNFKPPSDQDIRYDGSEGWPSYLQDCHAHDAAILSAVASSVKIISGWRKIVNIDLRWLIYVLILFIQWTATDGATKPLMGLQRSFLSIPAYLGQ